MFLERFNETYNFTITNIPLGGSKKRKFKIILNVYKIIKYLYLYENGTFFNSFMDPHIAPCMTH